MTVDGVLWSMLGVGLFILFSGALISDSEQSDVVQAVADRESVSVHTARRILSWNDMQFMQDRTTGLCFAYLWMGMGNGGPMMANVPCTTDMHDLIPFTSGPQEEN